ncbi:MAG: outer membrane beta-barrel domain-containing protein [Deltaproteobacteria bacterium]|nr:MAG: outer membrane beta-barrel domain-containing protein [Deltaproteobacteria bacterium]
MRMLPETLRQPLLLGAAAACLALTPAAALAQDTIDIGTVLDDDRVVVQRLLYPTKDRTEFGAHLGLMPFDAFLFTPSIQLSFDKHINERTSFSLLVGGGYGLQNATLRELQKPSFGAIPDAYRYLSSALAGVSYAPIYGKLNLGGARILHHDLYGTARAGVTLEQSIIPGGGFGLSPTLSLGVGSRLWIAENLALRVELRDDILIQRRQLTSSTHIKQNVGFTFGLTKWSAKPQRRR